MIETISPCRSTQERHRAAPLLVEREQYLTHLLQRGFAKVAVRNTAAYLIHIVRIMNLTTLRNVTQDEIDAAGKLWAAYDGPLRKNLHWNGSPRVLTGIAQRWFRFHGQLVSPRPVVPFENLVEEFTGALRGRGLAP